MSSRLSGLANKMRFRLAAGVLERHHAGHAYRVIELLVEKGRWIVISADSHIGDNAARLSCFPPSGLRRIMMSVSAQSDTSFRPSKMRGRCSCR